MEIQKWTDYCGIGIIGCCFRRRFNRPAQKNQDTDNQTQQPVILDTAHMGMVLKYCIHSQVTLVSNDDDNE